MADYEAISKVIRKAIRKEVDKQIDAAYRRGYADGKARIEPTKAEKEQIYNHGLDAAWECARKIYNSFPEDLGDIFDCGSITMRELLEDSPSYVVTKIKEYEEKQTEKNCDTCDNQNKTIGCLKHIDCQRNNFKHYEPKQTNSYRNNKYYNTFPTSKETADKIKAEYVGVIK